MSLFQHTNNLYHEGPIGQKTPFSLNIYIKSILDLSDNFGGCIEWYCQVELPEIVGLYDGPLSDIISDRKYREEIYEVFDQICYCEHDCCGHYNGGPLEIKRIGKRTYALTARYYENV